MTISIRCLCGKMLDADEQYRGVSVQCPHCQAAVLVPIATASSSPINELEADKENRDNAYLPLAVGCLAAAIGLFLFFYGDSFWKVLLVISVVCFSKGLFDLGLFKRCRASRSLK